jgi:hypothetical protein
LIIIKKWQLAFCDGDHCAAALLSFFEYWHNIKLELSQRARQANELALKYGKPATHDDSLLQFHTDEDLRAGLLGLYGTMKIRKGRRRLIEKGAITEHPNPVRRYAFDKTIYYHFHDDVINAWLARYNAGPSSARNGGSIAKNGERAAKNGERAAKNGAQFCESSFKLNDLQTSAHQITTEITSETTTTTQRAPQDEQTRQPEEPGGSGSSHSSLTFNSATGDNTPLTDKEILPVSEEMPCTDEKLLLTRERESPASEALSTTDETNSQTTATTTLAPARNGRDHSRDSHNLIFDFKLATLTPAQQQRTAKLLEGLDEEVAQQVLDELNCAIDYGSIKKSKWAWLQSVARSAREGTFIPTSDLADRRQAQAQTQVLAVQAPVRKPSQAWEEHREDLLHDGITSVDYHTYIAPLHGREDGKTLWLEAPNNFVANWVRARLPQIEAVMQPCLQLPIRICIG